MTKRNDLFNLWLGIIGLILILAVGVIFVIYLGKAISVAVQFFSQLDPQVATQIVAGATTVIIAVLTVVLGQFASKGREIREAHRQKKNELYHSFLNTTKDIIKRGNKGVPGQAVDKMRSFQSDLILYGSPSVIKAFENWQLKASALEDGGVEAFVELDNLYKAFRSDLGLSNKGLGKGDLIKLYLKPEEWSKMETEGSEIGPPKS